MTQVFLYQAKSIFRRNTVCTHYAFGKTLKENEQSLMQKRQVRQRFGSFRGGLLDIKEQFNLVAEEYDKNRKKFIPCFEDYYINTTEFIASNISKPRRILDLGAGTGLLSYFWHQHYPESESEYVLVDIADDMLNIARKRFAGINKVTYRVMNYIDGLPTGNFDVIVSALSFHHLENDEKNYLLGFMINCQQADYL